jgi:hypothetical protein
MKAKMKVFKKINYRKEVKRQDLLANKQFKIKCLMIHLALTVQK